MINGVDYGSVDGNKPPDFALAASKGLTFAIIRGAYTYRGQCIKDDHLARDRDNARKAGIVVGSYLIVSYDEQGPSPETQAQKFIDSYGARQPGELPPWIDAETDSDAHDPSVNAHRLLWIERVYAALHARYGCVGTYTSLNQWVEHFGGGDSKLGDGPLWCKVPYPWNPHNPPHPESCPGVGTLPLPWRRANSPGCWIEQYQGDAIRVPGFSATVDLDCFLPRALDLRAFSALTM